MPDSGQSPRRPDATRAWPDRVCLPLRFDPDRLAGDLAALDPRRWTPHFVPQHYDGDWSVLPLRAPADARHPIQRIAPHPGRHDWEDLPWLRSSPYFRQVRAAFACPVEAMRLMRLAPGSAIRPHRDEDLDAARGAARLHIPILTNPQVDFRLNGVRVDMMPGSVWYLRLADRHEVANRGTAARIHLVIDVVVDAWLEALLDDASRPHAGTAPPVRRDAR